MPINISRCLAFCFGLLALGLFACPRPGWRYKSIIAVPNNAGRAKIYLGEALVNNVPIKFRSRRCDIPLEGTAGQGELTLRPEGAASILFRENNGPAGKGGTRGVIYYAPNGEVKLVKIAAGVTVPEEAAKFIKKFRGQVSAGLWREAKATRLLVHTNFDPKIWAYTLKKDTVTNAFQVKLPGGRMNRVLFDSWASPPAALVLRDGKLVTGELACGADSCAWNLDDRELEVKASSLRGGFFRRTRKGVPVVVGVCPASGCEKKMGIPLVYPGGKKYLPLPDTITRYGLWQVRALTDGGLLVVAYDPDSAGNLRYMLIVVDSKWRVRSHAVTLAGRPRYLFLMNEPGRGEVAHLMSVGGERIVDLQLELSTLKTKTSKHKIHAVCDKP